MKYFLDTEFIEDGHTIDLISIGIVCEDGREFYAVSTDADLSRANSWVKEHVLSQLPARGDDSDRTWMPRDVIADQLLEFVGTETPEFWAYYADYDWVVLCQLFGTMLDLPKGWPMYCRDIKQLCDMLGNPKLPEQGEGEHNALEDARWNREAYEELVTEFYKNDYINL